MGIYTFLALYLCILLLNSLTWSGDISIADTICRAVLDLQAHRPGNDFVQLHILKCAHLFRSIVWERGTRSHKDGSHLLHFIVPSMNAYHRNAHISPCHDVSRIRQHNHGRDSFVVGIVVSLWDLFAFVDLEG